MDQDPQSIGDLLREAVGRLHATDAADTSALLRAAWHGFWVAGVAGQLLASCAGLEEYPPLWENARPVLEATARALRSASSLPDDLPVEVSLAAGQDDRIDDAMAVQIRQQILDLVLALNAALPAAAVHAVSEADRQACRDGTVLFSELGDCYEGRLRSFLNPWRTQFGLGSFASRARATANPGRKIAGLRRPHGGKLRATCLVPGFADRIAYEGTSHAKTHVTATADLAAPDPSISALSVASVVTCLLEPTDAGTRRSRRCRHGGRAYGATHLACTH